MIETTVVRLMIGIGVPLASALVMEQLPKTGIAEVPFAFQVEGETLPPGTYSVRQAERGHGVQIQNEKVAEAGLKYVAAARKFDRAHEARLVFDSYEGRYILAEIWFDADGRGLILPETSIGASSMRDGRHTRYVHLQ